jgi:hypothetical protein
MNPQTAELLQALAIMLYRACNAATMNNELGLARALDTMAETATALATSGPGATGTTFEDMRDRYGY